MLLADIFIFLTALLHIFFFVLESFLWRTPFARKRFGMSERKAEETAVLALNQGVYNLFLAAGLLAAQFYRGTEFYVPAAAFFLICVVVAGIVGAFSVNKRILFIQAAPAALGLLGLFVF